MFSEQEQEEYQITEDRIFHIYLYVFTNYFDISDVTDTFSIGSIGLYCIHWGELVGFYPSLALFNHSCLPNVYRYSSMDANNKLIFKAFRPIHKGEEISVFDCSHREPFLILID